VIVLTEQIFRLTEVQEGLENANKVQSLNQGNNRNLRRPRKEYKYPGTRRSKVISQI
jgi:hypothetical protein